MKLLFLLLTIVYSDQIIKNINIPACKNCIYYNPETFNNDFTSPLNKCSKFGEKNIINDKIKYEYADTCRNEETKCGKEGKYFVKEPNITMKILKYNIISKLPNILMVSTLLLSILNFIAMQM
jgi:hypothetical protein